MIAHATGILKEPPSLRQSWWLGARVGGEELTSVGRGPATCQWADLVGIGMARGSEGTSGCCCPFGCRGAVKGAPLPRALPDTCVQVYPQLWLAGQR